MKKRSLKAVCLLLTAALLFPALLSACSGLGLGKEAMLELSGFGVTAKDYDSSAIGEDAVFEITCDASVKKAQLEKSLSLNPSIDYALKKEGDGIFTLTPSSALADNTLYNLTIGDSGSQQPRTWAFQTRRTVEITGSLPQNGSQYVPLDTGIELYLSHMDLQVAPEFSIEPKVQGIWTRYKSTAVFMPKEPLSPDTLYTVTVKAGSKSSFGETSQDYTFKFRTNSDNYYRDGIRTYLFGGGFYETFMPEDTPVMSVNIHNVLESNNAKLNTYKLSGYEEALRIIKERFDFEKENLISPNMFVHDVSGMTPILSSDITMLRPNPSDPYVVTLPQSLSEGYYIIDVEIPFLLADGKTTLHHIQKLIQVTDTSVYMQSSGYSMLCWVNESSTGKPVESADFEIADNPEFKNSVKAKSDRDGIINAVYDDTKLAFYRITQNGKVLFAGAWNQSHYYSDETDTHYKAPLMNSYYSMFYTDRSVYLPDDKVNFWGYLRPRKDDAKLPEKVTAEIRAGGVYSDALSSVEVPVDKDGAFSGTLTLESAVSEMYYAIAITDGDKSEDHDGLYTYGSVDVFRYTKPEYTISLSKDKEYYTGNDKVKVGIDVKFYDGTPAQGIEYDVAQDYEGGTVPVVTDKNGHAQAELEVKYYENRFLPYSHYYWLNSTSAESVMGSQGGEALVIPRDTMLKAKLSENGDNVSVEAFRVDYSKIDPKLGAWEYNNTEKLRGAPADIPLKAEIWRVDIIRTQTGEYYDYINKKTVKRYSTREEEMLQKTLELKTSGGKADTGNIDYKGDKDKYYYLKVYGEDLKGRPIETKVYLGNYRMWRQSGSELNQYKMLAEKYVNEDMWYGTHYSANPGEEVKLLFMLNGQKAKNEGRILYSFYTDEVLSSGILTESEFKFKFTEEYFPNTGVSFAYFDGRHIYAMEPTQISLNPQEKKLDVEIKADKERYQPKDTVTVGITVKDKDGRPVQGSVALGVVDEAVFDVRQQNYYAVSDLYSTINYNGLDQFASYVEYDSTGVNIATGGGDGMGGGGGGGAETLRKDFVDTAFFHSGKSDENGKLEISFPLPDNITEWRITAISVSSDGKLAGDNTMGISSGIPFFVQPIVSQLYLEDDEVVVSARVRARDAAGLDSTSYTATLNSGGVTLKKLDAQGEYASFNFGKLDAGRYEVMIAAKNGSNSDAVASSFTVADSGLELPVLQSFDLASGIDAASLRYPVAISFSDAKYSTYTKVLDNLAGSSGERVDQRIARKYAVERLKENGSDLPYYIDDSALDIVQAYNGGVALFPYGDADPVLSAKIAVSAPEYIIAQNMMSYLSEVIRDTNAQPSAVAAAYMGLGALKSPVLPELRALLSDESFTFEERMYIIAGLGFAGDQDTALKAYEEYIAPLITRENDVAYLRSPAENKLDTFDLTVQALLAAVSVRSADATALAEYLCANPSSAALANLELIAYAKTFAPKSDSTGKFSYTDASGKKQTVDLAKTPSVLLTFGKHSLENAGFKVESGSVNASVMYTASPSQVSIEKLDGVTITKQIVPQGGEYLPGVRAQVFITVKFDSHAPAGYYTVSDYIPSGMRFARLAENKYNVNPTWQLQSQEMQNLSFGLYHKMHDRTYFYEQEYLEEKGGAAIVNSAPQPNPATREPATQGGRLAPDADTSYQLTYYTRCVLPGRYTVDSAYLMQAKTGRIAFSAKGGLTIREP